MTLLTKRLAVLTSVLMLAVAPVSLRAQEHGAAAAESVAKIEAAATEHGAGHDEANRTGEVLSPINKGAVTAITTLIVFLILLAILSKVAFGPIAAGLKKREDKIRQDIADAESIRGKADATLRDLTARLNAAEAEARAITSKATADAEKIGATLKARAQLEAEEVRAKALKDIETAKNAAIAEVHEHAVIISTTIAEKILKRSINAADQQDLVRSSLEQLANVSKN